MRLFYKFTSFIFRLVIRYYAGKAIEERKGINAIYRKLIQPLKSTMVKVDGHTMFLDQYDSSCLSLTGVYEEYETQVIKKLVKPGDTCLDIGAFIGYYILLFAKAVKDTGKVFAFEPAPDNFLLLSKNIRFNGYQNVELIQKAVGCDEKKATLYLHGFNSGRHRMSEPYGEKSIEVETIRLDNYFKGYDKPINFVKIDAEGMESKILEGMERILTENKQVKMVVEFCPMLLNKFESSPEGFFRLLIMYGFDIYRIDEWQQRLINTDMSSLLEEYTIDKSNYANLLCLKK